MINDKNGLFESRLEINDKPFLLLRDGNILIGDNLHQLILYDPVHDSANKIHIKDIPSGDLGYLNAFLELPNGQIFACGLNGIYLIDISGNIIQTFNTSSNPALPHNHVAMMSIGPLGHYWGGTKGGGLFRLSNNLEEISAYGRSEGLPDLMVPIVIPTSDHIICGTYFGLSVLDIETHQIHNYFEENGLSHNEFNTSSYYFNDSIIILGTLNGVNVLQDHFLTTDAPRSFLSLLAVKIYNRAENKTRVTATQQELMKPVRMRHTDSYVEFLLGLNNLSNPDYTIYRYKVEGFHTDYQTSIGDGAIRLEGLPAGDYIFKVKAADPSNIDSMNEISIPIYVAAIFYKTTWFKLLSITTLLGVVFFWYRRLKAEKVILARLVDERTRELLKDKETIEQQRKELASLDQLKNQFFANISHELRTPLTLITAPLEQVAASETLSEGDQYYVRLIKDNSQLLQERIDELLELSKLSSGGVALTNQVFDLKNAIDFCIRIFEQQAKQKRITYTVTQSATNVSLFGDEKKLSIILQNLISNAIKFTPINGSVHVELKWTGDHLEIEVDDSGVGLSKEDQEKVFDRFFQVRSNALANPGTGIGLSIVKEYIDLMGGHITIDSELGSGTIFEASIPLQYKGEGGEEELYIESTQSDFKFLPLPDTDKPSLLVVEDNDALREYIGNILSPHFTITTADNGQEALKTLYTAKIDIILSDIMMPEMDGVTLLSKVRAEESLRYKPFVFLTAKQKDTDMLNAYRIGVDDYIKKPFTKEELLHRLNSVYQNYKIRVAYKDWNDAELHVSDINQQYQNAPEQSQSANQGHYDFTQQVHQLILENLESNTFSIEEISSKLNISSRTLHRRLKKEVGLSPVEYVKEIRLNVARNYVEENRLIDTQELSSKVGFTDSRYFKKLYFERFGVKLN